MTKALLVIDLQNDYFPDGSYPLWNVDTTLERIVGAIHRAKANDVPVILVQHLADPSAGIAPFFNEGTPGAEIHPRTREPAPDAPVVVKSFADSFVDTTLDEELKRVEATELLGCGMMTQNCVTHTAISKTAERCDVSILPDCCATVDEMLHNIALHAVSTRVKLLTSAEAL